MIKKKLTIHDKRVKNFIGMTLIEALRYQESFSNGGELSGGYIKFINRGWLYELRFENEICVEASAKKKKIIGDYTMGYGAGHDVKLDTQDGYVKYNGRNLVIESTDIESWDLTHPMDGMTGIKHELLKIEFERIILSQDDRDWLKKDGLKKGESMYFQWDKKPEGMMWSGYCRSALKDTFPIDLKGTIDISGLGSLEVNVRISMNDPEEFKNFIEDVLDYYVSDEDCQTWINEGNTDVENIDDAREYLYEIQQSDNEANYKA